MKENPLRIMLRSIAVIGLLAAGPVYADYDLVVKKNCLACHQIDKRKYGPRKIRRGGTGVWGQDIMPPQPQVSAAEARTLANYVLSLQ
jgi:cytochrome c